MKDGIKNALSLTSICIIVALLVAVTNSFTAPVIENNKANAAGESLSQVLPGAKDFEKLETPSDAVYVQEIYRDTGGIGYAVTVCVTSAYSTSPMLYTVGVDNTGVITGIVITNYAETKNFGTEEYPQTYIGADSALNGIELVAGVTYSSTAFRQGVQEVFDILISMDLVQAGEKSESQKIEELMNKVLPGAQNGTGKAVLKEYVTGASWVEQAYSASNGTGYILVAADGTVCAVNAFGKVKAYDPDGENITLSAENINDAAGAVPNNAKDTAEKDKAVLSRYTGADAVFTHIADADLFSTVTNAFRIDDGGKVYYGFVSRPIGYNNGTMTVYGVLDENGSIVKIKVSEIILYSEYYSDYTLDESAYYENLEGMTEAEFGAEDTLISGATVSSDAVNKAVKDMFEAYNMISGGKTG